MEKGGGREGGGPWEIGAGGLGKGDVEAWS